MARVSEKAATVGYAGNGNHAEKRQPITAEPDYESDGRELT